MAVILIIDDDNQFRQMLRQLLERDGYEVVEATDGNEGLRLFKENQTDLVITDIFMPEKDGLEVIMNFRRNFPDTKIIALSGGSRGFSPEVNLQSAKVFGAKYIFIKPVDREKLLEAVKELLK